MSPFYFEDFDTSETTNSSPKFPSRRRQKTARSSRARSHEGGGRAECPAGVGPAGQFIMSREPLEHISTFMLSINLT